MCYMLVKRKIEATKKERRTKRRIRKEETGERSILICSSLTFSLFSFVSLVKLHHSMSDSFSSFLFLSSFSLVVYFLSFSFAFPLLLLNLGEEEEAVRKWMKWKRERLDHSLSVLSFLPRLSSPCFFLFFLQDFSHTTCLSFSDWIVFLLWLNTLAPKNSLKHGFSRICVSPLFSWIEVPSSDSLSTLPPPPSFVYVHVWSDLCRLGCNLLSHLYSSLVFLTCIPHKRKKLHDMRKEQP